MSDSSKQQQLRAYLRSQVREGNHYFKSKFIASDLQLSAHEIGVLMNSLQESVEDLQIEKWGCARATTWYVDSQ